MRWFLAPLGVVLMLQTAAFAAETNIPGVSISATSLTFDGHQGDGGTVKLKTTNHPENTNDGTFRLKLQRGDGGFQTTIEGIVNVDNQTSSPIAIQELGYSLKNDAQEIVATGSLFYKNYLLSPGCNVDLTYDQIDVSVQTDVSEAASIPAYITFDSIRQGHVPQLDDLIRFCEKLEGLHKADFENLGDTLYSFEEFDKDPILSEYIKRIPDYENDNKARFTDITRLLKLIPVKAEKGLVARTIKLANKMYDITRLDFVFGSQIKTDSIYGELFSGYSDRIAANVSLEKSRKKVSDYQVVCRIVDSTSNLESKILALSKVPASNAYYSEARRLQGVFREDLKKQEARKRQMEQDRKMAEKASRMQAKKKGKRSATYYMPGRSFFEDSNDPVTQARDNAMRYGTTDPSGF